MPANPARNRAAVAFDLRALTASAALFAILFASFAHALLLEAPQGTTHACPGQTAQLNYYLVNDGNETAVVDVSLEKLDWATASLAPNLLTLRSGERASMQMAITPDSQALAGTRLVRVNAEVRSGGSTFDYLEFRVKDCPAMDISVSGPAVLYSCSASRYTATLHNSGPNAAIGKLETSIDPAIQAIAEEPYVVLPGATKQVPIYFNVPCNASQQKIYFTVAARDSRDNAVKAQYASLMEISAPQAGSATSTPATTSASAAPTTGFFTAGSLSQFAILIVVLLVAGLLFWTYKQVKKQEAEQERKPFVKVYEPGATVKKLDLEKKVYK